MAADSAVCANSIGATKVRSHNFVDDPNHFLDDDLRRFPATEKIIFRMILLNREAQDSPEAETSSDIARLSTRASSSSQSGFQNEAVGCASLSGAARPYSRLAFVRVPASHPGRRRLRREKSEIYEFRL